MKRYLKMILLLLVLVLIVFLGFRFELIKFGSFFSNQEEKNSSVITERIEKLCNISTVKYNYQEILDYTNTVKLGEMELPFGMGDKKVLLTYRAYATGGCRLIRLDEVSGGHIKVSLGKGEILDNVLELDSISIYDIQQGIFNKFSIGDDTALINEDMKKYIEENKEEIINTAEKNADDMIRSFLQTLGYENIEIVFQ